MVPSWHQDDDQSGKTGKEACGLLHAAARKAVTWATNQHVASLHGKQSPTSGDPPPKHLFMHLKLKRLNHFKISLLQRMFQ